MYTVYCMHKEPVLYRYYMVLQYVDRQAERSWIWGVRPLMCLEADPKNGSSSVCGNEVLAGIPEGMDKEEIRHVFSDFGGQDRK